MSKKSGEPFEINEMDTEDIYDLKNLTHSFGSNFSTNEKGEKVIWNEIKEIKVEKEMPYLLKYKTSFQDNEYNVIKVHRWQRGRSGSHELIPAYRQATGINATKKKDLIALCEANHIKSQYHDFYKNLTVSAEVEDNNE